MSDLKKVADEIRGFIPMDLADATVLSEWASRIEAYADAQEPVAWLCTKPGKATVIVRSEGRADDWKELLDYDKAPLFTAPPLPNGTHEDFENLRTIADVQKARADSLRAQRDQAIADRKRMYDALLNLQVAHHMKFRCMRAQFAALDALITDPALMQRVDKGV